MSIVIDDWMLHNGTSRNGPVLRGSMSTDPVERTSHAARQEAELRQSVAGGPQARQVRDVRPAEFAFGGMDPRNLAGEQIPPTRRDRVWVPPERQDTHWRVQDGAYDASETDNPLHYGRSRGSEPQASAGTDAETV